METIFECCAFSSKDFAARHYIAFRQRWEAELRGASEQVGSNGISSLEEYDMSLPLGVADKGLGRAKQPSP